MGLFGGDKKTTTNANTTVKNSGNTTVRTGDIGLTGANAVQLATVLGQQNNVDAEAFSSAFFQLSKLATTLQAQQLQADVANNEIKSSVSNSGSNPSASASTSGTTDYTFLIIIGLAIYLFMR
jgi:hypothetical protein